MTIKIRKSWKIDPVERVKNSQKIYNRAREKRLWKKMKYGEYNG